MKIYRDGKEIELTEQEMCDTYTEVRIRNYKDEVALKLAEDYNIDPSTANINITDIALDVICEVCENDTIFDCEQEAFHKVIKSHLKRIGGFEKMKIKKVYPAGWKLVIGGTTYYFGEYGQFGNYKNNGVVYKDRHAFETGEGVCYINEYGFEFSNDLDHLSDKEFLASELVNNPYVAIQGYTRQDLLDVCNGNERLAEDLFDHLDWMAPETLFDEWERELFDEEEGS